MNSNLKPIFFLILFSVSLIAQDKKFTMEEALLKSRKELAPQKLSYLQWIPNSNAFSYVDSLDGTYRLFRGNAVDTQRTVIVNLTGLNNAMKSEKLDSLSKFPDHKWIDQKSFRFWKGKNLIQYNYEKKKAKILNSVAANAENKDDDSNFRVAFTLKNNLFIAFDTDHSKQITFDEEPAVVNGEYVHRREFGIEKGTFWSPKGNYLAYYRKDQRMVTPYPLVKIDTRSAEMEATRYPMAGMTSEQVQVGVYNLKTGSTTFLQTGEPKDQYLTNVTWSPDEKFIYIVHLNRDQNHLRLVKYDVYTGKPVKTLFEETNPKYVEPEHAPVFVNDNPNRFVWFSERDGFNHLYLYDTEGDLKRQLTEGNFEITKLHGLDQEGKYALVTITSTDGLERHVASVNLSSGKLNKLTNRAGTHEAEFNDDKTFFLDSFSSINTPHRIIVRDQNGNEKQVLLEAENPVADYQLGKIEFLKLQNEENIDLNARLIYPTEFNSTQKYPVIVYVYGGPHAQLVRNTWLGGGNLWFQYLAQRGYFVFTLDNRGSAHRGLEFEQAIFRNMGAIEVADQMVGVDYLKSLPYVDSTRIGVTGWSYGGFMTISLMTREPGVFKAAACGGPVIDWRYYEVMYTERYMDTPEANPAGYEESNLLNYIDNLQGNLLIIHGTMDPTVVWQHSLLYLEEAIKKGKQLDYFVYPGHKHGVRGKDRVHLYTKMTEFFNTYLKD